MTRFMARTFFKGMAVILPVVAAIYVIVWLIRDTESAVKRALLWIIPSHYYIPGAGLMVVLVTVSKRKTR